MPKFTDLHTWMVSSERRRICFNGWTLYAKVRLIIAINSSYRFKFYFDKRMNCHFHGNCLVFLQSTRRLLCDNKSRSTICSRLSRKCRTIWRWQIRWPEKVNQNPLPFHFQNKKPFSSMCPMCTKETTHAIFFAEQKSYIKCDMMIVIFVFALSYELIKWDKKWNNFKTKTNLLILIWFQLLYLLMKRLIIGIYNLWPCHLPKLFVQCT